MGNKKLKPCPIPSCGGEATVLDFTESRKDSLIGCIDCKFSTKQSYWERLPRVSDEATDHYYGIWQVSREICCWAIGRTDGHDKNSSAVARLMALADRLLILNTLPK